MKEMVKRNKLKFLSVGIIIYFIFLYAIDIKWKISNYQSIGAIAIAFIIVVTNWIIIKQYEKERKINDKKIIISIILIGLILRTVYILYTPITERQHDMEPNYGHLAYIETIYETGKLPTNNKWQFYQQPLHHILAAGWLKINNLLGIDLATSEEGIQILTAIYSSMIMLITYGILKELNVKGYLKILAMLIISIHPTLILLAGSINNDILAIMLTFLGLFYLIKWQEKSNLKNTILLAIVTGLIALTKIAGTIIAVPILYVFINKFWEEYAKDKDNQIIKKYLGKFTIFGIISLTLGLSYSIRNLCKFKQSIFYVPTPGSGLYCGDRSLFTRFNIFSSEWKTIFCNPIDDGNIIVYLIKSSLFGEYNFENFTGKIMAAFMIMINIVIICMSLVGLIKLLKKKEKSVILNLFILFYITEIIMYLYSNISMPYGCTMDFRYIVPTILIGSIFMIENMREKNKRYGKIASTMIITFAILSVIFELTYMSYLSI